jgi:hypothetical protein
MVTGDRGHDEERQRRGPNGRGVCPSRSNSRLRTTPDLAWLGLCGMIS